MSKGFSLVEILVAVGIIGVVAAIGFSAAQPAIKAARIASAKSNLRQLHLSIELYRADHQGDGTGLYGLDLPSAYVIYGPEFKHNDPIYLSPCRYHPSLTRTLHSTYYYYPSTGEVPEVQLEAQIYGGNFLLFYDMHCTDHSVDLYSRTSKKLGLGVTLEGRLIVRRQSGNWLSHSWWTTPVE